MLSDKHYGALTLPLVVSFLFLFSYFVNTPPPVPNFVRGRNDIIMHSQSLDFQLVDLSSSGKQQLAQNETEMIPMVKVDKETRQFLDEEGYTRFVRGMSVAYKVAPYLPDTENFDPVTSFTQVDIDLFQRLNLNVIRLPVTWAAVQPTPDGYDEEYLEKIVGVVERLEKAGIYVLIEAHQDLYASRFCGNGMPAWSIKSDWWTLAFPWPTTLFRAEYKNGAHTFPSDDTGGPNNTCTRRDWGKFYMSDEVTRAFWGLYTDEEVQGPFVAYWEKLARTFSSHSNVIGYELLNEPFVASRHTSGVPLRLFATRSSTEKRYLLPLYDRLSAAIRKWDRRTMLWWEPVTGAGADSGEGFDRVPGLETGGQEKSVMSFHSYGPNLVDGHTIQQAFDIRLKQIKKLGGAAVLTEYDCEFDRGLKRIQEVMELADEKMMNWIGWQYKQFIEVAGSPPSGTFWDPKTSLLRPSMLHLFSRPYPASISGVVHSYSLNFHLGIFRLTFTPKDSRWSRIAIVEDEDCGWGEWIPKILVGKGVESESVVVKKGKRGVEVSVGEDWKWGESVTVMMTARLKRRVEVSRVG